MWGHPRAWGEQVWGGGCDAEAETIPARVRGAAFVTWIVTCAGPVLNHFHQVRHSRHRDCLIRLGFHGRPPAEPRRRRCSCWLCRSGMTMVIPRALSAARIAREE